MTIELAGIISVAVLTFEQQIDDSLAARQAANVSGADAMHETNAKFRDGPVVSLILEELELGKRRDRPGIPRT